MFELTLCIDLDSYSYFDDFYKIVADEIKKDSGIIMKQKMSGKYYLAMASSDKNKDYLKAKILDLIVNIIIEKYKKPLYKELVQLDYSSKLTDAFLEAISFFDSDIDREIITSLIELKGKLVIESFFYFKLQTLANRWEKTAKIINQNAITSNETSMIDVLKYLCNNSDNNASSVGLKISKGKVQLKNLKKSTCYKTNERELSKLLSNIVRINPTRLTVALGAKNKTNEKFVETLEQIFEDKIYFE